MKYRLPIAAVSVCALPLLVAWSLPRATVRFAPAEGIALTKTFNYVLSTEMNDMTTLVNGADPGMTPKVESKTTTTRTIGVTDVYERMGDGRPLKLVRTYDEFVHDIDLPLSIEMMGESQEADMHATGSSDIVGLSVAFTFDEDEEEYTASFVDEEGDEELLEGLAEDLDLRVLLPYGEVSEGDSWSPELSEVVHVLFPGGAIAFEVDSDGDPSPMGSDPFVSPDPRMLFDVPEGDATATFAGTREVDGATVAVIQLEISVDSSVDMSEYLADTIRDSGPEGMELELESADAEWSYQGKGELLWNMEGGHMHSLELVGDVTTLHEQEMSLDMGGQAMSIEQTIDDAGTFKHSAKATVAKN